MWRYGRSRSLYPSGSAFAALGGALLNGSPFRSSRVNIPREDDGKFPRGECCEFLAQSGGHRSVARIEARGAAQSARWLPAECDDPNPGPTGNLSSDPLQELKHCTGGSPILCRAAPERACEESSFRIARV